MQFDQGSATPANFTSFKKFRANSPDFNVDSVKQKSFPGSALFSFVEAQYEKFLIYEEHPDLKPQPQYVSTTPRATAKGSFHGKTPKTKTSKLRSSEVKKPFVHESDWKDPLIDLETDVEKLAFL